MAERRKSRTGLEQDALVEALVPDPSQGPPDATVLQGYLGKGTTAGVWRLYLTPQLDQYVELPEDEILYSQKQPDDGTLVWVRKGLRFDVQRPQAAQVQAEFLAGNIAGARLAPAGTGRAAGPVRQPVMTPQVSLLRPTCPSAVDACPSGRGCPPVYAWTRHWRCWPSVRLCYSDLGCMSVDIPCNATVRPENCPSLGIVCTNGGPCVDPSLIDACPTWICGPPEPDPLL